MVRACAWMAASMLVGAGGGSVRVRLRTGCEDGGGVRAH